jgi:enoyl-CoA hydratase
MNTFRCMRPVAARAPFQRSTLPRIARAYSSKTYEYIQVSQPKPGVGQGMNDAEMIQSLS